MKIYYQIMISTMIKNKHKNKLKQNQVMIKWRILKFLGLNQVCRGCMDGK